jgi:hypothetical protein
MYIKDQFHIYQVMKGDSSYNMEFNCLEHTLEVKFVDFGIQINITVTNKENIKLRYLKSADG